MVDVPRRDAPLRARRAARAPGAADEDAWGLHDFPALPLPADGVVNFKTNGHFFLREALSACQARAKTAVARPPARARRRSGRRWSSSATRTRRASCAADADAARVVAARGDALAPHAAPAATSDLSCAARELDFDSHAMEISADEADSGDGGVGGAELGGASDCGASGAPLERLPLNKWLGNSHALDPRRRQRAAAPVGAAADGATAPKLWEHACAKAPLGKARLARLEKDCDTCT